MAKIDTIFNLIDRMSRPLQTMENNMKRAQRTANATGDSFDGIGTGLDGAAVQQSRFNALVERGNTQAATLKDHIKGFAAAYIGFQAVTQGVSTFVRMSDELTSAEARLAGIVDDTQTLEQLSQKVYDSAQRSRGAYASTAQFIARVGQMAGDLFTNDELVKFAETINKQMVINGTSTWEAEAAMVQLSQALGSGVLRGEELNSVFEQAPGIIKTIADYLDVDIGQIRAMASEGQLTAEVVKNAVLSSAGEIDEAFEKMPMTWAQTRQNFTNQVAWAMRPLSDLWSQALNSEALQSSITRIASALAVLINLIVSVVQAFMSWEGAVPLLQFIGTIIGVVLVAAFLNLVKVGVVAFVQLIAVAGSAALAFMAAHAPLIAFIAIFALIVQGAQDMGMSVGDVFTVLGGGTAGVVNAIGAMFSSLWENIKIGASNAAEWIKSVFINGVGEIARQLDVGGVGGLIEKFTGVNLQGMSYTPNYQSFTMSSNMAAAYDKGYDFGSYFAGKAVKKLSDGLSGITSLYDQVSKVSGESLNIGDITTADDLGFSSDGASSGAGDSSEASGELEDLLDTSDDTAKTSAETAKNTKDIYGQMASVASDMAYFKAQIRKQAMQKIEQNIKLNINAPIKGTTSADIDGFFSDFTVALEDELKNKKRGLASVGV